MNYFDKVDACFKREDEEVSDLERAARICNQMVETTNNIQAAILAERCAIKIRSLLEWSMYVKKDLCLHDVNDIKSSYDHRGICNFCGGRI